MVVQRSVIVTAQKFMQINIEEFVSRNNEPAQKIWVLMTANNEVRWSRICDFE